ncbi:MAG: hypothetical protein U5P10_05700 [Spirochaetia bacterium]|nr:hypothetical protein [Spirochaetia bacterium]
MKVKQLFTAIFISLFFVSLTSTIWAQTESGETDLDENLRLTVGTFANYMYNYDMLANQGQTKSLYETSMIRAEYNTNLFDVVIEGTMNNDDRYDGGDEQQYLFGRYFLMEAGYTDLKLGPFNIRLGRSNQSDAVDNPYSIYINSEDIPKMQADVSYEGNMFFYRTRWVSLNSDSNQYYTGYQDEVHWEDRGMNYKVYGVNVGDWRFGFQDSVVYLDQEFDPEYFLNPIPMYLIQIINSNEGRPWGEYGNVKSQMGFFAERTREGDYGSAQIMIDDLNGNFLPTVENQQNLTKMAWSIGGRKDFPFGTVGAYHAGATKYTFQATYAEESYDDAVPGDAVDIHYNYYPYEYTYYPVSVYKLENGDSMPLHYTENYIGYKYGENNIAFMVDYENSFTKSLIGPFSLYSSLEWILNGSKAPNNPWHEGHNTSVSDMNVLLLDGTIEQVVVNTTRFSKPLGGFNFNIDLILGGRFNAMTLDQPVENEAYIFYPQAGKNEPIAELRIGGTYTWDF